MGERLDDLGESAKASGSIILDSTTGVVSGILLGAYPLLILGFSAMLAVVIVRLPTRLVD